MSKNNSHISLAIEDSFVSKIKKALENQEKLSRIQTEKIAKSFGILDKTKVKELTELAIVLQARDISLSSDTNIDKYDQIVQLYNRQTNLSFRTSMSVNVTAIFHSCTYWIFNGIVLRNSKP